MSDAAFKVDRKGLAEVLGVSRARIDALVREGLPAERRGSKAQPWRFDLRQAVPWWAAYRERIGAGQTAEGDERLDATQERARLDRARAALAELDRRKREGEILEREDVVQTWASAAGACKRILRALPKRLRSEVPGFTGRMARAALKVIDEALHELASVEVEPNEPEGRRAA